MLKLNVPTVAVLIGLACSCSTLDGQTGDRGLRMSYGHQAVDVKGLDEFSQGVAIVELETKQNEVTGTRGVLGASIAQGETDGDVDGAAFEAEADFVNAHAGLRWEPAEWEYALVPVVGGGVSYMDLDATVDSESLDGESIGDRSLGGYGEFGLRYGAFSLTYRQEVSGTLELEGLGDTSVETRALMIGYSVGF